MGFGIPGRSKVIFPHRDWDFLESELRRFAGSPQEKFIVVESLFSMDGDRSPIGDLVNMADRYGAELIVDEAHAVGVLGPQGRGLVAEAGTSRRVLAAVYPCGKALASAGAFVCGSQSAERIPHQPGSHFYLQHRFASLLRLPNYGRRYKP